MQRVFIARVRPIKFPFGARLPRVLKGARRDHIRPAANAREYPPALDAPVKPGVQARFMG